jgi:nucleotide-binding universal stress UspA family protein
MAMTRQASSIRILGATDLLGKSEAALERAGMMADRLMVDLSLLHVVVPTESERTLEQDLQQAIARMKDRSRSPLWKWRTTPNVIVTAGQPANRIVETIDDIDASLVVLGPHRKRVVSDALTGTIAEKVLSTRAAPILFVKREPRAAYRRVLVALDLSAVSAAALRAAESFAMTAETHATIVHAHEPHYEGMLTYAGVSMEGIDAYSRFWDRDARSAVWDLVKREARDSARYEVILERSRATPGILNAADRLHPDLLVMGTRGHGRFRRALLGGVANRVLNGATCDVLIVPDGSLRSTNQRADQAAAKSAPTMAKNTAIPTVMTQSGFAGSRTRTA